MSLIHEQLTCSICLELYDNPVRLVCFHVFCQKCIADNLNIPNRRPVCPECNAPIENAYPPKKDFKIAALVQTIKDTPKCSEHNEDIDTLEECKADVLCRTCCKLLCVKCAFSEKHRKHEMEDLKTAITKQKDMFAKKIPGIKRKIEDYNEQLGKTKKARKEYFKCELSSKSIFGDMISAIQADIEKLKGDGEQAIKAVTEELMILCKEKESKLAEKVKYGEELVKSHSEFEKDPATSFKVMKENAEKGCEFYNPCLPDLPTKPSVTDVFKRCPVIEENFVQLNSLVNSFLQKIENNMDEGFVCRLLGVQWNTTTDKIREWFGENVRIVPNGVHMVSTVKGLLHGEAFIELVSEKDVEAALTRHKKHMGHRYIQVFRSKPSEMAGAIKRSKKRDQQFDVTVEDGKNVEATNQSSTDHDYSTPKMKYSAGKYFYKTTSGNKQTCTVSSITSSGAETSISGSTFVSTSTSLSDRPVSSPGTSVQAGPSTSVDSGSGTSSASIGPVGFKSHVAGSKNLSRDVNAAIKLIAEANFSTDEFASFLMFFQEYRNDNMGLSSRLSKKEFAKFALQSWRQVLPLQRLDCKLKARHTDKYQRALQEYTALMMKQEERISVKRS